MAAEDVNNAVDVHDLLAAAGAPPHLAAVRHYAGLNLADLVAYAPDELSRRARSEEVFLDLQVPNDPW